MTINHREVKLLHQSSTSNNPLPRREKAPRRCIPPSHPKALKDTSCKLHQCDENHSLKPCTILCVAGTINIHRAFFICSMVSLIPSKGALMASSTDYAISDFQLSPPWVLKNEAIVRVSPRGQASGFNSETRILLL